MVTPKQESRLALAGLDERDLASDNHPYLQLAQAQARRTRTAILTPGGLSQPPEVMGVDADARVPNQLQPMDGEFEHGHEVGDGRPAFFGRRMPPPTGLANGVGVGDSLLRPVPSSQGSPFGGPTGMPTQPVGSDRFADPDLSGLTALTLGVAGPLPRFAEGNAPLPGHTGIVGKQGEKPMAAVPEGGLGGALPGLLIPGAVGAPAISVRQTRRIDRPPRSAPGRG